MEGKGGYLDDPRPRAQDFLEAKVEACPVCHGPGKLAEVERVHDEAFEDFLGEHIQDQSLSVPNAHRGHTMMVAAIPVPIL